LSPSESLGSSLTLTGPSISSPDSRWVGREPRRPLGGTRRTRETRHGRWPGCRLTAPRSRYRAGGNSASLRTRGRLELPANPFGMTSADRDNAPVLTGDVATGIARERDVERRALDRAEEPVRIGRGHRRIALQETSDETRRSVTLSGA